MLHKWGLVPFSSPHQLRDAEVGDLDPALLVEQHVLRLDVAMDHAVVVGVLQGVADLRHDGQGFFGRELARIQQPAEVQAVDELHEEVIQRPSPPAPLPEGEGRLTLPSPSAALRGGEKIALTPGPSPGRRGERCVWPKS